MGAIIVYEIVFLRKSMGLNVDSNDVWELIKEHQNELTTEEIQKLQRKQQEMIKDKFSEVSKKIYSLKLFWY